MFLFFLDLRNKCIIESNKDENKGKKIFRFVYERWVTRFNHLDTGEISDIQIKFNE